MVNFLLLNGGQKATLIERFDGSAAVIAPSKRYEFDDLEQAKHFIKEKELEINVSYLFGSKRGGREGTKWKP